MSISHPSCPLNPPLDVLNFTLQLPFPSFCEIALVQLQFSVMSLICIEKLYKAQSQKVCPGRDNFGNVHNIHGVKRTQRHFSLFLFRERKMVFLFNQSTQQFITSSASLVSPQQMPVADSPPSSCDKEKCFQTLSSVPWEAKLLLVENQY